MATITVDSELAAAYRAAPKLRQREALSLFRQALRASPRAHKASAQLSKKETALFLTINRNLPEEKQARYDALTEKRLAGRLTQAEQTELGALIVTIEQLWLERLQAIGELARLRKVTPEQMMQQLELEPRAATSSKQ